MRAFEVVEVAVDAGVSASKPLATREAGGRVVEAVRARQADVVVAYKLDRLFRDAVDCLEVTRTWDQIGASVHLVDQGGQAIDTSTAMGRFMLTIMAGVAEMERNLIRERTVAALAHKAAKGERVGQVPFGYEVDEDGITLVPLEAEQATIAKVQALRDAETSIRAIAARLNEDGDPARGSKWHPTTVARILKRAETR
jgi:DNA invertase Pin-like site-specific DNA recombinase